VQIEAVETPEHRHIALAFVRAQGEVGLSENKAGWLERDDGRPGDGVLLIVDGAPVAYAGVAPARAPGEWAVEVVADDPTAAAHLIPEVERRLRARGGRRLRWWTYDAGTEQLPPQFGFQPERRLLRMASPLPRPHSEPGFPPEVEVRGFTPGRDEDAWLEANNAAFAGHRENSNLDRADLRRRMEMDWFDPEGLRMAWWGTDLAGFCWTKRHGAAEGEIYIIGAVPGYQGRGLGKALVLEGMRYLAAVGCTNVFLYTEGDNSRAVALYESLGFEIEAVHRSFIEELD